MKKEEEEVEDEYESPEAKANAWLRAWRMYVACLALDIACTLSGPM